MAETRVELAREDDHAPSQVRMLLQAAWRRKALLLLGVVVGLVVGALYYAQKPAIYQANAQLLVVKKGPDALPVSGLDQRYAALSSVDDYLATHMVLIKSPVIVGRAAEKRELKSLRSFKDRGDPAAAIPASLSVTRDTKETGGSASNILYLSYRGQVPEDCPTVLNAITDSYREFLDETYRSMSTKTVDLISQAKTYLSKTLKEKEETYRKFRQEAPLVWKGKDGVLAQHERLASLEAKRSGLVLRRVETESRLSALDAAIKSGKTPAAVRAMVVEMTSKPTTEGQAKLPTKTPEDVLLPLLLQEQTLLEDFGPDHPQVVSIRNRIEYTKKYLADLTGPTTPETKETKEENAKLRDPVFRYQLVLVQQLEEFKAEEAELDKLLKTERDQAKSLMQYELQEETLRNEVARTQQLYDSVIKRLQEIDLGKESGGFEARLISPPGGGVCIEPKALPIFAVALVVGLLFGCGMAYLADTFDQSFRSPDEIRQRLGLHLVGHIPVLTADKQPALTGTALTVDPLLLAYHHPRSMEAEAYRGVRTSLYFSTHGEGHKVIQITSPSQGDGKSTLAANLAVSIAQSGKRVLLMDADLRRPRLHTMFGLANERGLSSIVSGNVEWREAILTTAIPNLSVMPSGPIPPNPAELLTAPRFQELVATARDAFDFVILDTPPLLAVTDPCAVAPRVDGVVLTLRLSKNGRPQAERAREILQTLGARVFGVVVNGLSRRSGGYGYTQDTYKYETDFGKYEPDAGDQAYYETNGEASTNGNGHVSESPTQPKRGIWDRLLNR